VTVEPSAGPCGAEVRCGPLQAIDDATFREVHRAWLDHLVLVFRDQRLTDEDLAAFAERFGPIKPVPRRHGQRGGGDEARESLVHVVSNVVQDGVAIGILGSGDVDWHSDMVAFAEPPSASLLHALEVPPSGGDTLFMNMYLAWETLPEDVKRRIVGLRLKHAVAGGSSGAGTGASHPIVCTHPETGCNALFLGSRANTSVEGLPAPESEELLALLWGHVMQWRFIWRHQWRVGDVVVWDNRCLLHARQAFDPGARRVLHRTQVQGPSRPETAPDALGRAPHTRPCPA
jgi:alpha-ketoglutarate-dependent taurine dioxygenase